MYRAQAVLRTRANGWVVWKVCVAASLRPEAFPACETSLFKGAFRCYLSSFFFFSLLPPFVHLEQTFPPLKRSLDGRFDTELCFFSPGVGKFSFSFDPSSSALRRKRREERERKEKGSRLKVNSRGENISKSDLKIDRYRSTSTRYEGHVATIFSRLKRALARYKRYATIKVCGGHSWRQRRIDLENHRVVLLIMHVY